jgi:hypothetical protein
MLVKLPGQRSGEVVDRNVETVDILPTIAAQLGIAIPRPVDGLPLFASAEEGKERDGKLLFRVSQEKANQRFELPAQLSGRLASAKRAREWLNDDRQAREEGRGLLAMGPHRELQGRPLSGLEVVDDRGYASTLAFASSYEDVDPSSAFLPARVTGEVRSAEGEPAPHSIAVVLNGRIEATARTFSSKGSSARFAAMLPESAFVQGANEVEILVLEESGEGGGEPLIAATRSSKRDAYKMIGAADGRAALLLSSRGRLLPILPGAIRGMAVENGLVLGGEARDVQLGGSAESALVFADGQFLSELPFEPPTGDEEEEESSATSRQPRFRILVPYEHRAGNAPPGLRVFAVSRGRASELEYRSDFSLRDRANRSKTSLQLEHDPQGAWLSASTGERIALAPEPVRARRVTPNQDGTKGRFELKILSEEGAPAPVALLVFASDRFALVRPVDLPGSHASMAKRDTASPEVETSGRDYEVSIPTTLLQRLGSPKLRFVVVSQDGRAHELAR